MLPFILDGEPPFENGDYIYIPNIAEAIKEKKGEIDAYIVGNGMKKMVLKLGELTDDERKIILAGCLINFYRG